MPDPVNLLVPADARFRGLGPEVGARYMVAVGGSQADASSLTEALARAMDQLAQGAGRDAEMELDFRAPGGTVEVTVRCHGQSEVVTHPLPASKQ